MGDEAYRWSPQKARITIQQVEEWYMDEWERENELFTYRFGYLKLSPIPSDVGADASNQRFITELPTGYLLLRYFFPLYSKIPPRYVPAFIELFKVYKDLNLPKRIERNFGFLLNKLVVE